MDFHDDNNQKMEKINKKIDEYIRLVGGSEEQLIEYIEREKFNEEISSLYEDDWIFIEIESLLRDYLFPIKSEDTEEKIAS